MDSNHYSRLTILRARVAAVLVGFLCPLLIMLALKLAFGSEYSSSVESVAYGVGYLFAGGALGFTWPQYGWRLSLWLAAFWLCLPIFDLVFADPTPWNSLTYLRNIALHVSIVIPGLVGLLLGRIMRMRASQDSQVRHDSAKQSV